MCRSLPIRATWRHIAVPNRTAIDSRELTSSVFKTSHDKIAGVQLAFSSGEVCFAQVHGGHRFRPVASPLCGYRTSSSPTRSRHFQVHQQRSLHRLRAHVLTIPKLRLAANGQAFRPERWKDARRPALLPRGRENLLWGGVPDGRQRTILGGGLQRD